MYPNTNPYNQPVMIDAFYATIKDGIIYKIVGGENAEVGVTSELFLQSNEEREKYYNMCVENKLIELPKTIEDVAKENEDLRAEIAEIKRMLKEKNNG